jgi:mRNA interferase MazF
VAEVTEASLRWAVVLVDLDPSRGHEQAGTRRALVVSYEAFHRSGMATVCPITTRAPKYPGEVPLPDGHAEQTREGLILCHQVRTLDLSRVRTFEIGGRAQYVTDPAVRAAVRSALAHQLGLDLPAVVDGAARG